MADETDVTSEVARVLAETSPCIWSIAEPEHPYGKDFCLDDHPDKHPGVGFCWVLPTKQAKALAEAGLLREFPGRVDGAVGGETSNNSCPCSACERARTESAQIDAQEPAGAGQGGSGESRTSVGLGERLRALIPDTYTDDGYFGVTALEIGEFADEAHRLEVHARVVEQSLRTARAEGGEARAVIERVRAQFVRMTKSSDEKTQRHGTALLHILDGDTP